uniref:Uncharacterized protein n=1 Tax=Anguilla anguilla TaxID=7936 RepID=A0A0E9X2K5_ANGAN
MSRHRFYGVTWCALIIALLSTVADAIFNQRFSVVTTVLHE